MLVSAFIARVNYALRGTDDDQPVADSEEWNYWIDTLNRKKDELFEDVTKQWRYSYRSTPPNETGTVATTGTTTLTGTGTYFLDYEVGDKLTVSGETVRTIATITSNTSLTVTLAFSNTASGKTFTHASVISINQEYALPRSFLAPSDRVYVLNTSNQKSYYNLYQPQEKDYVNQNVQISGADPQVLTFTESINASSNNIGGTLFVPGYYMPADVSDEDDVVPAPDPNWLVMAVASEIAFNDITYEDRTEGLNAKANSLYSLMVKKNRRGTYANRRRQVYDVRRIRDTRVN